MLVCLVGVGLWIMYDVLWTLINVFIDINVNVKLVNVRL